MKIDIDDPDVHHPWPPTLRRMMALGAVGLLLSAYLIKEHYAHDSNALCDVSSTVSCSRVNQSPYSVLFGVPVALFGGLWNAVVVLMAGHCLRVARRNMLKDEEALKSYTFFLLMWCLSGVAFVIYFVIAEFLLHAICLFCTLVHIIVLVLTYYAQRLYMSVGSPPGLTDHAWTLRRWLTAIFMCNLWLIVAFNLFLSNATVQRSALEEADGDALEVFAKCIHRNHFSMFGSMGCGHCVHQKTLLGSGWRYTEFVECALDRAANCSGRWNITSFPTWLQIVGGKETRRHSGMMDLPTLGNFTGCPAPAPAAAKHSPTPQQP